MIKVVNRKWRKGLLIGIGLLLMTGIAIFIYYQTLTHQDTTKIKAEYTVEAIPFIKEFEKDYKAANKKYAEKIISVSGIITKVEQTADTIVNIKISDTTGNSYLIFAFQDQHIAGAKMARSGDRIQIKGSCSDAIYSDILEGYSISFKRSAIDK